MRTLTIVAALLLAPVIAAAQDLPKPLSIAIEPLGDRDQQVVARVFFRFANPRAITEAGLFLEGSFTQDGQVPGQGAGIPAFFVTGGIAPRNHRLPA